MSSIGLLPIRYFDNHHGQSVVIDGVDHAVITHSDTVQLDLPLELPAALRPRFTGQVGDPGQQATLSGLGEASHLALGSRGKLDSVGHSLSLLAQTGSELIQGHYPTCLCLLQCGARVFQVNLILQILQ
jgi:hypothetical protein